MRNIFSNSYLECFIKKGDEYLLLHRNSNKRIMPNVWMAPGGKREFYEGLYEATRREVLEETNIGIKNIRVKAVGVAFLHDLDLELHLHLLIADYVSGQPSIFTEKDGTLTWFTADEIVRLDNLLAELRPLLPHIFSDDLFVVSYKAQYEEGNNLISFEIERS